MSGEMLPGVMHVDICDVCEIEFIGGAEFERHGELVPLYLDIFLTLTEKEFEKCMALKRTILYVALNDY